MRSFVSFLFINILFISVANSQVKISVNGKVTDAQTGQPLAGSNIYLPDLRTGVVAASDGSFTISNISKGKYLVEVSHAGYSSLIEQADFSTTGALSFSLQPAVVENEGVTVTGVSSATSAKRTPVPVTIIKKAQLFNTTSTNIIDNISKIPGVSQVSTGPAISKPFIRGLGYNRVLVVNDGIRQEGQQWGDEHGIEIDEQNVSKVEVMKGPASLMYGSDALAGVVNILSIQPAPEGRINGTISSGYLTNNRQRSLHADINGNKNGFIWGIDGSYKAAADYKNKYDGYVFNSKFNERNFGGYLGLNKHWGYSHLYISSFDQKTGLVEGERDDATGKFLKLINNAGIEDEVLAGSSDFHSLTPSIPYQRIQHQKIALDNSFRIGTGRLTLVTGYQRNQRKEFGNVLNPQQEDLYFDLGTFTYNAQYHFAEKNNWKTTLGVNGMSQTNKNKGDEQLIPEYSLFDIGTFLYTQKRIKQLTLSGGLRYDSRSLTSHEFNDGTAIKFAGFKKNFSNVSGSAGLTYEANKIVTLKFNIARGFRAPSIPELASNGAHEGTNRYEYGEQNLKSENSLQTDAGVEIAGEHISLNASVFYNAVKNFIYYRKLSSVNGGDSLIVNGIESFYAFKFQQDNAKLYGVELNLDIHPHPLDWLHIENSFSWVLGLLNKEEDGSKNLPLVPAARLINEVKVDLLKKGKLLNNIFIKAELDNTFSQNDPFTGYNTETATKGYSLFNMAVGGDIRAKNKTLASVFIGANNIADIAYQNHLSRLKYTAENLVTGRTGVFNMGRNFSFKLNIPLDVVIRK